MTPGIGIEQFSWPLFWAGALGAFLLDLTRWVYRLQHNRIPRRMKEHISSSVLMVSIGGGTAGIFGGSIEAAWMAASIGAGAPAVLRTMATLAPKIIHSIGETKSIVDSLSSSRETRKDEKKRQEDGDETSRKRDLDTEQIASSTSTPKELRNSDQSANRFVTISHLVTCHVHDFSGEIAVQHRLVLRLEEPDQYLHAGITNLQEWTRNRLELATREALFGKSYIDLVTGYGPDEVRRQMEFETKRIGYGLQLMTLVGGLEPLAWKEGFLIEIEGQNFVTSDSSVEVSLDIIASGKITKLRNGKLAPYWDPQARDLREDIKAALLQEIQKNLHAISPERFYMRFSFSGVANEEPVRDGLESAVKTLLSERFAFEQVTVTLKPRETDLTRQFQGLLGPHQIQVRTPCVIGDVNEEMIFQVTFDIIGVSESGWHTFHLKCRKFRKTEDHLEEIIRFLVSDIQANLETIPAAYLVDMRSHEQVEAVMMTSVNKVDRTFGVVIQFLNMRRDMISAEVMENLHRYYGRAGDIDGDSEAGAALKEFDLLLGRERHLLEAGVEEDDEELRSVNERIEKLKEREHLHPGTLPANTPDGFLLEDYEGRLARPISKSKQSKEYPLDHDDPQGGLGQADHSKREQKPENGAGDQGRQVANDRAIHASDVWVDAFSW